MHSDCSSCQVVVNPELRIPSIYHENQASVSRYLPEINMRPENGWLEY